MYWKENGKLLDSPRMLKNQAWEACSDIEQKGHKGHREFPHSQPGKHCSCASNGAAATAALKQGRHSCCRHWRPHEFSLPCFFVPLTPDSRSRWLHLVGGWDEVMYPCPTDWEALKKWLCVLLWLCKGRLAPATELYSKLRLRNKHSKLSQMISLNVGFTFDAAIVFILLFCHPQLFSLSPLCRNKATML